MKTTVIFLIYHFFLSENVADFKAKLVVLVISLRLKLAALSPKDKPCPMTGIGILGIEILGTFF